MFKQKNSDVRREVPKSNLGGALHIVAVLGVTGILALGLANSVYAGKPPAPLTDRSIAGAWAFSADGTIVPDTPAVAAGTMTFDGYGGCVISDVINIGGMMEARTSTACTYVVNSDGTGSMDADFAGIFAGAVPLFFVIVDNVNEIRFIRTDVGVASGVVKRLYPEDD